LLRLIVCALPCVLPLRLAWGERVYYDVLLEKVLDGDQDVALCLGVEEGRVRQRWAYIRGRPEVACPLVAVNASVDSERLAGPVTIQIGTGKSNVQRLTPVLDLPWRGNGQYSVTIGCPVAPRSVKGNVTLESPTPDQPDRYVLWLMEAFGPKTRFGLVLHVDRAKRTMRADYGWAGGYNTSRHPLDIRKLTFDGNKITGTVEAAILPDAWVPDHKQEVHARASLTAELDKTGTLGRYEALFGIERKHAGTARVTRTRTQAQFAADNALAASASWPSWLGPNQNFASGPTSRPIIEDLRKARLVWVSQYIGPPESGSKRYGACIGLPPCAGGASPLVADGKVFQFRYQPTGAVYQAHADQYLPGGAKAKEAAQQLAANGWTVEDMKQRWKIDADEELVCLDAATGRTLWTVRFPGEGLHLYDHKCSLTNHTGAVADGVVYVFGALGIVRAVDGSTGKVLWSTAVPGYHDFMVELKKRSLAARSLDAPSRSFCHGLNVVGPVVVAPSSRGAGGAVAIDRNTGTVRWTVQDCLGAYVTPMALRLGKEDFVLCADGTKVTVLDPLSGRPVYTIDNAGENSNQPLLAGDVLIVQDMDSASRKTHNQQMSAKKPDQLDPGAVFSAPGSNFGQVKAYRLGAKGAVELWKAPIEWGAPNHGPVGSAIGELACFRGKYSYHIVETATGRRVAASHLSSPARFDEGILFAMPGMFILQPDSQHGHNVFFPFPARPDAAVGPVWRPPHRHATTYQVGMSHAWADGRLFIRGHDAIYCYDLRAAP